MSDCRDLAFHVQEQHPTLGQIESFVNESGLRFINAQARQPPHRKST
jgi:hypothetical protein